MTTHEALPRTREPEAYLWGFNVLASTWYVRRADGDEYRPEGVGHDQEAALLHLWAQEAS